MADESIIKLFEDKKIRIVWNEKEEKYYSSSPYRQRRRSL